MKAVLISIQLKWCELIASGKKTVEVRKTKPSLDTPFKCYIYMTNSQDQVLRLLDNPTPYWKTLHFGKGKVIGEFICDRIQTYESEFVDDDCYENIASLDYDEYGDVTGFIEWSNDSDFPYESSDPYKKSCVSYEELKKYVGIGFNKFYGWHISKLVIYDNPKELSEFYKHTEYDDSKKDRRPCAWCDYNQFDYSENHEYCSIDYDGEHCIRLQMKRPPQSWCYVDHPTEEGGDEE